MNIDWTFFVKLGISSGFLIAILKWAGPRLFKTAIREAIAEEVATLRLHGESIEDHDDRINKNEMGVQTHTHELAKLKLTVGRIDIEVSRLDRIDRNLESMLQEMTALGKLIARMEGRLEK